MGSSLRNRLSRVTEAAPGDLRRDARTQERGGGPRRQRSEGMVEQRSGRGHDAGSALAGLLGASQLFGAGSDVPGRAGMRSGGGDGRDERPASRQLAAREAAGRAGSAFTGAAGMAARAGQSAASATRDASSTLAHRMSDVSTRMAERSVRMADRPEADLAASTGRPVDRPAWDDSRERSPWDSLGHRPRAELDPAERTGRRARLGRRRETATAADELAGRVAQRAARMPMRGQASDSEDSWERAAEIGGQRSAQRGRNGRGAVRHDERGERLRTSGHELGRREQTREPSPWAPPTPAAGVAWDELRGGHGRVHGVSKRHQRRIEKAQYAADDLIERAYEASERAMRHSHSRRARRSEHKATTQADRAQRALEQHLARAESRMARSHQRRRRGLGMVLLAGAGAGTAVAVRRYLDRSGAGQPAGPRDDRAGRQPMPTEPGGFPGTDRLSERMASKATSGRMEEMPGVDTMIDPSSARRF